MNLKVISRCISGAKKLHVHTPHNTFHYSFIIKKRSIVSVGYNNRSKTHPLAEKFGYEYPNLHSELACLINANMDAGDCYMINIRFGKGGDIRNSRPCKNCQKVLRHYDMPIVYSTGNGFREMKC